MLSSESSLVRAKPGYEANFSSKDRHIVRSYRRYSTYYKPMGDLPYISSDQGWLIICTELIYDYTT